MINTKNSSSTASLAIQSIVTVAGIATIHSFVSGGMIQKITKFRPNEEKTKKRESPKSYEDSKEEEIDPDL